MYDGNDGYLLSTSYFIILTLDVNALDRYQYNAMITLSSLPYIMNAFILFGTFRVPSESGVVIEPTYLVQNRTYSYKYLIDIH